MTSKILNQLTEEQIDLVHDVTNSICKAKGYHITISRSSVELVLQAVLLINHCSNLSSTSPPSKGKNSKKPNSNTDTNPI